MAIESSDGCVNDYLRIDDFENICGFEKEDMISKKF